MVLTFLRAELDSPRFGSLRGTPAQSVIENANLENSAENVRRRDLLGMVRGFGRGTLLFPGFPTDVAWRRVRLEASDAPRLLYAGQSTWIGLAGESRHVVDGAARIGSVHAGEETGRNVLAIAVRLRAGDRFEDLIGVVGDGSDLILVEGHARATAYVLAGALDGVTMLLGSSPAMRSWKFY